MVGTILKQEERTDIEEMEALLQSLSEDERKEVKSLIRGVLFGVQLARNESATKKSQKGA